jgi:hypothetical protein
MGRLRTLRLGDIGVLIYLINGEFLLVKTSVLLH